MVHKMRIFHFRLTRGGFIKGILRGVRCTKSLRVLFLHRWPPSWTTLVLYSRAVFTKYVHIKSTTVYARPSSELGLSQPLSRQRVFPSPQKQGGGGTLACGWGVGGSPNSDEGNTLWYSLYVRTLWQYSSLMNPPPVCFNSEIGQ
jgi:hypothetical protein